MPKDFDAFEEQPPPPDELFEDDNDLKKKMMKLERKLLKFREEHERDVNRLKKQQERALLNNSEFYESQIELLRKQNEELFEKNLELHETSKIFVKGLEHLKKEGKVITQSHQWTRKGGRGLKERINDFILEGKKITVICPTNMNHHGDTMEAVIVTEHTEKYR